MLGCQSWHEHTSGQPQATAIGSAETSTDASQSYTSRTSNDLYSPSTKNLLDKIRRQKAGTKTGDDETPRTKQLTDTTMSAMPDEPDSSAKIMKEQPKPHDHGLQLLVRALVHVKCPTFLTALACSITVPITSFAFSFASTVTCSPFRPYPRSR